MFKKMMKRIIPVGIVIAAVVVATLMVASREKLSSADVAQPLPQVRVIDIVLGDVPVTIIAHGTVSARIELELASEVTGRVESVAPQFESGEMVTSGTVLLKVDPTIYRLALAEAKAALASAKNALADATALKRSALMRESELNIEAAHQRIAKAEQDLAYTEIKAPFDAVIDEKLVDFGQFISTGRTVARLLSSETAEVRLPVKSAEVGLIDTSSEVVLSVKIGEKRQQWKARILRIESRVDRQTRVIPVVVEVNAPYELSVHAYRLPLGLFVTATIAGKPISAAARLPISALQTDDTVFVLSNNTLQRRKVEIVFREGDSVVVNGGLENSDVIVISRLEVMFEGMKVERSDA